VPGNVQFVPVDFEKETLATALPQAGVALDTPAFFAMLGVSQYLTEAAFDQTLGFVLSTPSPSELVFSFVVTDTGLSPDDLALVKAFIARFAAIGEPWRLRFAPEDLLAKLNATGFRRVFHLRPEKANQRYFQNRRDGLSAALIEQMISAGI
jgi:O-methyltransferase involved in polyketide biosynthesis